MKDVFVRVWDPLVRFGHWLLVIAFAVAYLSEGEPLPVHVWAGYAIAVYVVVRLLWGFVGSKHARFSDFLAGPAAVFSYLKALPRRMAPRYLGHSPAGGAMVIALLVMLAATTMSGMALLAVKEGKGPLSPFLARATPAVEAAVALPGTERGQNDEDEADEASERRKGGPLKEVHEVLANLTLLLVILHVAGVVLASWAHRENLARSMVTGRKRPLYPPANGA